MQICLIEDYAHYLARGGVDGSGGIYLTEADLILVPFEGLGLKKRNHSYALDHHRTNQTLMHEATHMLMRGPLLKDGWFVEGTAEYVATIPMRQNSLLIANHLSSIKSYITANGYKGGGGFDLGTNIELTPLKHFMEADYATFQSIENSYPYALLLFYYLVHADQNGDAQGLRNYAQALHDGAESSTARKHILAGRDYRTLEKLLTNSWSQVGINLSFRN